MLDWKSIVRDRVAALRLQGAAESDLTEELAQHLEDRYHEYLSGGASEEEAYRKALSELDDMYPLRAEFERTPRLPKNDAIFGRDARQGHLMEGLWRDLRYAGRAMRKSPMFVLFVILTLALGIGANTTVFTVINTLILNPLPVPNSSSLEAVGLTKAESKSKLSAPLPMSYADLKDYQVRNGVFRSLAGYTSPRGITLQVGAASQGMFGELVTGNYFSTLGLTPARGRFFLPEEDSTPGAHAVAVMNYGTWQGRFGGARDIVGKTLRLNNVVFTVIGVAPPRFIGMNALFGPDLWVPAAMAEQLLPNEMQNALSDRGKVVFRGMGRFKPLTTRARAQANMTTIAADLARDYPATNEGYTATVRPVRDVLFASSFGASTPILFASIGLLIVVGIVLLIACSNVANLLLARSAVRQQEMAIRLAMGASRRRLVRQLLTESVLLGFLSGALGLLIGYAGLRLLFGALPASANFVAPKLDATVFVFALLISLARPVSGLHVEERHQRSQADKITTIVDTVDRNYFETAGVTIDSGRGFTNIDQEASTPVAIVNEKMAHDYWPGGDALGKRIQLPGEKQMRQIVGVVRTASYSAWGEPPQFCVYVPLEQNYSDGMALYVRSKGDPKQILMPVQQEIRAAGPQIRISVLTGRQVVDGGLFQEKMGVALLSVFGLLALGLASIGLYGIMAYSVNQRKREIGLRMALGAAQPSVLWLILKQGMSLVLTGVLIGFAAALLVGRLLSRMLYDVSASDPISVAGAAAVLLAIALLACYLPARWASRIDPLVALREG